MTNITSLLEFVPGLPVELLHQELAEVDTITALGRRKLARCLFDMEQRKVYSMTGHKNASHYAMARHGMSQRSAQEFVNVGRHLEDLSLVDKALLTGEISWSKLKILIRVVVPATERAWLERAEGCNVKQLAAEVRGRIPGQGPKKPGEGGLPEIRMMVTANLMLFNHQLWEQAKRKLSDECGCILTNEDMMIQVSRMILCTDADGKLEGRSTVKHSAYQLIIHQDAEGTRVHTDEGDLELSPLQAKRVKTQSELVPASRPVKDPNGKTPDWLKRRVLARDNHSCLNCGDSMHLQVHHAEFRRDGGQTAEDILASLCSSCHSMVHTGLLCLRGNAVDGFEFLDRTGVLVGQRVGQAVQSKAVQAETRMLALPIGSTVGPAFGGHVPTAMDKSLFSVARKMMINSARRELVSRDTEIFCRVVRECSPAAGRRSTGPTPP